MDLGDSFELNITAEDMHNRGPYVSNHQCLLGTAMQRQFGLTVPDGLNSIDWPWFVDPIHIHVDGRRYVIPTEDYKRVKAVYRSEITEPWTITLRESPWAWRASRIN